MIAKGTTTNDLKKLLENLQKANEKTFNQHLIHTGIASKITGKMAKSNEENTLTGWLIRLGVMKDMKRF